MSTGNDHDDNVDDDDDTADNGSDGDDGDDTADDNNELTSTLVSPVKSRKRQGWRKR